MTTKKFYRVDGLYLYTRDSTASWKVHTSEIETLAEATQLKDLLERYPADFVEDWRIVFVTQQEEVLF